jgi:uncharacterized integral membrane protein (TIGR00698 family)
MANRPAEKLLLLLPGLGLAVLVAAVSQVLSLGHATLDPLVLSILISIILGNLIGARSALQPGIEFTRENIIPLGIILYGTQVDLQPLRLHGIDRVVQVITMVFVGLAAVAWLSKALGVRRKTGLLLAAGTAICGASAIIVLSPVVQAEKEDTSISLLAITVIGLTGVILYPILQEALALSEERYAFLCASTLPQMGQVQAAASLLGESALKLAVPIKLLRVGMLLPVAVVFSIINGRDRRGKIYIPWFIVGFLVAAVAVNLFPSLSSYSPAIAPSVRFFFSIAIAGIGLSIDLEAIIDAGPRPLLASLLGWIILVILFLLGVAFVR